MPARQHATALKSYADLTRAIYEIPYGIPGGDHWEQVSIWIKPQIAGAKDEVQILRYRLIKNCLNFLLGHAPFATQMLWAPVKKSYGLEGARVYDEMNTGTWWWDMQQRLPPGATLVPIILATDKTIMTKLGGDRVTWPIYLQIRNHTRQLRREQQVPSTILVGLLPVSKAVSKSTDQVLLAKIKSEVYHHCMKIILSGTYHLYTEQD